MFTRWSALSSRSLVAVLVVVGLVVIGIGIGVFGSTPVEAECAEVYFRNSSTGYCLYGCGPCDPTVSGC